jgi:heat shock protein HtpX
MARKTQKGKPVKEDIRRQKRLRTLETAVLIGLMGLSAALMAFKLVGLGGVLGLLGAGGLLLFVTFRSASALIPSGAVPLDRFNAGALIDIVSELGARAGLPRRPRLYLLPSPLLNAAATGGGESTCLVVTTATLERLSRRELIAVLAHEISHIKNDDLSVFRFAEGLRRVTHFLSLFGWIMLLLYFPFLVGTQTVSLGLILLLIAAPLASLILQLALFRTREFSADLGAAEITGDPEGLAQALRKIDGIDRGLLSILLPIPRRETRSLFRTHPSTEERSRRLRSLSKRRAGVLRFSNG